jgi:hypothetical protein
MQIVSPRIVFIKLAVIAFACLLAMFCFVNFSAKYEKVSASASGPSPSHTNAPNEDNCTSCHTSFNVNSGTGNVSIAGVPINYLPNKSIPITVTTTQSDAVIFGFQLTAIDSQGKKVGTFTLPTQSPQQLQTVDGIVNNNQRTYVEHTNSGVIPTQFGSKTWNFTWNAPAQRVGKISFYVAGNAANSDGGPAGDYIYTTNKGSLSGTAISNFDDDDKSDVAVFRPSNGYWYSLKSTNGSFQSFQFGESGDKPVAGDFDGDGKNDYAVWRPSNGYWYVTNSSDGSFKAVQFGTNGDVPVVGDYDGDGKADYAVYRPSNGYWFFMKSTQGFGSIQFGESTDKTVQGDYDADGVTDVAVYRPSNGYWFINKSRDGFFSTQFGSPTDKPVPADYDGDGKTDVAVYRPSSGYWYRQDSRDGFQFRQFGEPNDKPAPADFDGDGKTDIAVYRPSIGYWFVLKSLDNSFYSVAFGSPEDIPVPSGFIAE